MAMELGGKAAIDAVRAWRSIREWRDEPVKVLHAELELPLAEIDPEEVLLAKAEAMGDPEALKGLKRTWHRRLLERVDYLREGNVPPKSKPIALTLVSLGGLAICPLPFEIFSRITLRIKEHSPFVHTLVPGYSNGSLSYFPSMDQLCRGGYEVTMFRGIPLLPFADDAEHALVAGCLKLLRELYAQ